MLVLMETSGGDAKNEIQFCHQCFSVGVFVGEIRLPIQLNFGNRLRNSKLLGRAFFISTGVVYLLLCLNCQWLHSFLTCVSQILVIVACFSVLSFG